MNFPAVLRYKLSKQLNACVLDRPCLVDCSHQHKKVVLAILTSIDVHTLTLTLVEHSFGINCELILLSPRCVSLGLPWTDVWSSL